MIFQKGPQRQVVVRGSAASLTARRRNRSSQDSHFRLDKESDLRGRSVGVNASFAASPCVSRRVVGKGDAYENV